MRRVALLVALVVGAASFGLFVQQQRAFEDRVSGGEPIPILVASSSLPLGETLSDANLAIREIPESYVEDRHIRASDAAKVIGIRTTMGLKANEAILWTDLAVATEEGRVLSGLVQNGLRAITVTTAAGGNFGGLLRPGDRIDLLFRANKDESTVVLPLLQNVLVLAVGQEMGGQTNIINMVRSASSLTLSVSANQAQALTLAQSEGSLTASLRNPGDIVVSADRLPTTLKDIYTAEKRQELQSPKSRGSKTDAKSEAKEIEHVR